MAEMRQGYFCRACRRTRSQIEAAGENWQEHLNRNSQGVAAGATPAELAAKEQEFDRRIEAAKGEEAQAIAEANASGQRKNAAAQDVINSFVPWKQAMLAEDEGRAKAWDSAIKAYKERFDAYENELASLNAAIARNRASGLRSQQVHDLELQKEDCQARLRSLTGEAQDDYFRRGNQEALFEQRLESGRKQLESFVSEVGGPPLDVMSRFTTLPANGKLGFPGTPLTLTTSQNSVGLNGSFGLFKASLRASDDWLRNTLHVDLMLGIDTPSGPLQIGGRQTTVWGPDGTTVTTNPVGSVPKPQNAIPDPVELLKGDKPGKKQ